MTSVLFVKPLILLFLTSREVCPGFQSQGGSLFACFFACMILKFTSAATPAHCVEVNTLRTGYNEEHGLTFQYMSDIFKWES